MRSRAAAQLLKSKGFENVLNLKGGIKAWQGHTAAGPPEMGMILLKGDESPAAIITLAYGLEQSLQAFYTAGADAVGDAPAAGLLRKLAEIETRHQHRLYELSRTLVPSDESETGFAARVKSDLMEGGFAVGAFMAQHRAALTSRETILELAMSIEAQGMDLYMRYAERVDDQKAKEILRGLADEEKTHLTRLGEMISRGGGT